MGESLDNLKTSTDQATLSIKETYDAFYALHAERKQTPKDMHDLKDGQTDIQVGLYEGPAGVGYITYAYVKDGEKLYLKVTDNGPEGRSHDWKEISKPVVQDR